MIRASPPCLPVGLDPIPSPQAPPGADLLQAGPRSLARGPEMFPPSRLPRPLWPGPCSLSSLRLLPRESWATALSRSRLHLLLSLRFPYPWLFASSAGVLSKAPLCRRPTVRPHAPPASSSHGCAPVTEGGSHFKPSPVYLIYFSRILSLSEF